MEKIISRKNFKKQKTNEFEKLFDILELNDTYLLYEEKGNSEKFYLVEINEEKNDIRKENLYNIVKDELFPFLAEIENPYYNKKNKKNENKIPDYQVLYQILKDLYKQKDKIVKNLIYDINFRQEETIKLEKFENDLYITKNNVSFYIKCNEYDFNINKYKFFVKKYLKDVFPHFIEYLDYLTLNLFDKGRKTSYVYLNVFSNWGKSFLMDLFAEMKIGVITNSKSIEKVPSPLTPEMFNNKVNLFIDEFKIFKSELKEMTNKLLLESKNRDLTIVPVFLKTFLSAEYSASFEDGVDQQILNRVLIYNYSKEEVKGVEYLKEKENVDTSELMYYLKIFTKRYIQKRINYLKNKDGIYIQQKIKEIFDKRKLEVENIEHKIIKLFLNEIEFLLNNETSLNYNYEKINDKEVYNLDKGVKIVKIENNTEHIYISNIKNFLEILLNYEDEETQKKIRWKLRTRILNEIFETTEQSIRLHKVVRKFYKVNINYLKQKLNELNNSESKTNIIKFYEEQIKQLNNKINELQKNVDNNEKEKENEIIKSLQTIISKNFGKARNLLPNNTNDLLNMLDNLIKQKMKEYFFSNSNNDTDTNTNENNKNNENIDIDDLIDDEFPF